MQKVILAIETATDSCSAAIYTEKEIYARHQIAPKEHSKFILGMVDELLEESGLSLDKLDAIAVGVGPGSFTGLRLAVSVAQGLAFGAKKNILPVSTLCALAHGAFRRFKHKNIVAVLDARMHQVYLGMYHLAENGLMEAFEVEDMLWDPNRDLTLSEVVKNQSWLAVGTGVTTYHKELEKQFGILKVEAALQYPSAIDVAIIAAQQHKDKTSGCSPKEALPVYIRNKVV